ncbi:hypothetical protein P2G56_14180, partial [Cronobacter malonaticus]|nr:hypothetical protein [Cronobacter malonaticus]
MPERVTDADGQTVW